MDFTRNKMILAGNTEKGRFTMKAEKLTKLSDLNENNKYEWTRHKYFLSQIVMNSY